VLLGKERVVGAAVGGGMEMEKPVVVKREGRVRDVGGDGGRVSGGKRVAEGGGGEASKRSKTVS